jgi:hypothetical protein
LFSPRAITLLAGSGLLKAGEARLNEAGLIEALKQNTPRGTYGEAWADTDGSHAKLPDEMLPLLIAGLDLSTEAPEVIEELVEKVYRPLVSVQASGKLQTALNGDGRSVLANASVMRNGIRRQGARYISDDPLTCIALQQARLNRVRADAQQASSTASMVTARQPELVQRINGMMLQTAQDVARLLAPLPAPAQPAQALPNGNDEIR